MQNVEAQKVAKKTIDRGCGVWYSIIRQGEHNTNRARHNTNRKEVNTMSKMTDLKHEHRKAAERLIEIDRQMTELAKEKEALREQLVNAFEVYGHDFKAEKKSIYRAASIQRKGEVVMLVYRSTLTKGRVNYKALCKAHGISEAEQEKFRGSDYTTTSIGEATEKQLQEMGL